MSSRDGDWLLFQSKGAYGKEEVFQASTLDELAEFIASKGGNDDGAP